jgi:hypothetical protein
MLFVHRGPTAGAISPQRVRAAIARISRAHAGAFFQLETFLGESGLSQTLTARVEALIQSATADAPEAASRLLELLRPLAGVVEACEMESEAAADLAPVLAGVIGECELIVTSADVVQAA